jgi:hypothetical protein
MRTCSKEEKLGLNRQELAYFKDEKAMRRFADNESLDKRVLLLTRIGIRFAVILESDKEDTDKEWAAVISQYKYASKRREITEAMAKKKMFVFSSRELMVGVQMAAQNSHSNIYVLDYDYVNLRDRLSNYRIEVFNENMRDAQKGVIGLSKVLLANLTSVSVTQQISGVTEMEMQCLLALFPYSDTFVSGEAVNRLMYESDRTSGVLRVLSTLEKNGYVTRHVGYEGKHRKPQFTIAEKGIRAAMDYMRYIVKNSK